MSDCHRAYPTSIYNFGVITFRLEIFRRHRRPIFSIRIGGREIRYSPRSEHDKNSDPLYVATKFPSQTFPQKADSARWKKQEVDLSITFLGGAAEGTEVTPGVRSFRLEIVAKYR